MDIKTFKKHVNQIILDNIKIAEKLVNLDYIVDYRMYYDNKKNKLAKLCAKQKNNLQNLCLFFDARQRKNFILLITQFELCLNLIAKMTNEKNIKFLKSNFIKASNIFFINLIFIMWRQLKSELLELTNDIATENRLSFTKLRQQQQQLIAQLNLIEISTKPLLLKLVAKLIVEPELKFIYQDIINVYFKSEATAETIKNGNEISFMKIVVLELGQKEKMLNDLQAALINNWKMFNNNNNELKLSTNCRNKVELNNIIVEIRKLIKYKKQAMKINKKIIDFESYNILRNVSLLQLQDIANSLLQQRKRFYAFDSKKKRKNLKIILFNKIIKIGLLKTFFKKKLIKNENDVLIIKRCQDNILKIIVGLINNLNSDVLIKPVAKNSLYSKKRQKKLHIPFLPPILENDIAEINANKVAIISQSDNRKGCIAL